ncbi:glycoside hydrolase family 19 protein [Pseudomonas akapageensis]|uniref:glycoside hydrolase family 19 protein n=1 Tax=Pseudomonas akapageensis TaxID=2609961 RepID=UPI001408E9DE|nr:glycoside hydrolase family 19 protein [Pseudomonas akapageensis]
MASLLRWLFGVPQHERDARFDVRHPPILSTPDTDPVRAASPAELSDTLPPVQNWSHPFKETRDPLRQLTHLADAKAGFYPLGVNGLWHGGVHFDDGTASTLDPSSVHCLADGEVVAYRIDQRSPTTSYIVNKLPTLRPFSRNFVLVRHRLQAPKIEGSADTPPSLTFFSLYLHLQDWAVYQADAALTRSAFWPEGATRRVKETVNDFHPRYPNQPGLNVRHKAWQGQVLDLLPRGAQVTVSGDGDYRKLENSLGPADLISAEGSLRGYVAISLLEPIEGGQYRVATKEGALNVRAEAKRDSDKIGELPKGTEVTISGDGDFRKLERVNQYVHYKSLPGGLEPLARDRVVVLDQPVPIKAGDLIGHIGLYQDSHAAPEKKLHLEVFSGDEVEPFIQASRAWAQRLPASSRTWLKLAKGTVVAAHQEHFSAKRPPNFFYGDTTSSDADLLVPKSLLDGLSADCKITEPATSDRKAYNWYRLDGLLHDADHKLIDGWVREEVDVTPWVSPWSWEGYDIIYHFDLPRQMLASFRRAAGDFSEAELERFGRMADEGDQGQIKQRLVEIIGRNSESHMTAKELQAALKLPAHAQSIAQLIIRAESEWYYRAQKWDALDEILGHSGSTPNLNWLAEKERLKQLSWWDEVAEKVGLPGYAKVYHFHAVGLAGRFQTSTRRITVDFLEKITGKTGDWFTGKGGGRTFTREFEEKHPQIYKYDKYKFVILLNEALERYGIISPHQQAHFISQCFHESAAFETTVEFASGTQYDPGNHTNATASGNTEVGDGPKYKGKGLIQLTWKNNYRSYSKYRGIDFVSSPGLLAENMFDAIDVSCWYWRHNGAVSKRHNAQGDINVLINNEPNNVGLVTLAVNGGTNGLHDRTQVYESIRKIWGLA